MQELYTQTSSRLSSYEVSKVLRNTYALLGMTLAFATVTAVVAMAVNAPYMGLWMLLPYFVCVWMVEKTKNSTAGLFWVFALTGWLGFTAGPIVNAVIGLSGMEPVLLALGGTALIFFATSGYILVSRRDMSFATGFIMTGILVAFIAMLANWFLDIPGLGLAVSCIFLVLSSLLIMWQTSRIIHGGETNYISATVTLFVSIYNIFMILLSFLGSDD